MVYTFEASSRTTSCSYTSTPGNLRWGFIYHNWIENIQILMCLTKILIIINA